MHQVNKFWYNKVHLKQVFNVVEMNLCINKRWNVKGEAEFLKSIVSRQGFLLKDTAFKE